MELEDLPMDHRRKAIQELQRGLDFATQLRKLLIINANSNGDTGDGDGDDGSFVQHLAGNVLSSFTNTLFLILNHPTSSQSKYLLDSSSSPKSEDSQGSCKASTLKVKVPRGRHKRRSISPTWEKESETPTEDGHQWRKYGQKVILNAKYSRNYYRCTHRFDQGCQATKQMQRVQEKPPLYRTTYYGHHTCKNWLNPDFMLDHPTSPFHSSILLSFDKSLPIPPNSKQNYPFSSTSSFPSLSELKKKCKEEEIPSSSSHGDYLLSPQLTLDNSSSMVTLSSTLLLYDSVELDDALEPFLGF